jgi:chemotaxis protein MotB
MAKEKPKAADEPGCPLWMMTFGDAMSLLVTFFVMLVSFASFEENQLQDLFGAMKGGLMAVPIPMATTVASGDADAGKVDSESGVDALDNASSLQKTSQESLAAEETKNIIRMSSPDYYLHLLDNGVSLVIRKDAVFEPGTATIMMEDKDLWQLVGDLMALVRNEIRVEATLPETVMVRLNDYTTAWGLGIEQTLAIQNVLVNRFNGERGQVSTSVRVPRFMPKGMASDGVIEIIFVGLSDLKLKHIPEVIMRGIWRDHQEKAKEKRDGQEEG